MSIDGNAGRFLLALGGFLGFGCAFISALKLGHDDVSAALLRASIGMIVGTLLMKLLLSALYASAREARNERMRASTARQKAQEQAGEEAAAPVTKQH
jgi:predicted histidine transporter YuiF (NhaC family)